MGTPPQPDPTQAGAAPPSPSPDAGAPPPDQPSQAPASPEQVMLAQMYQLCKRLAAEKPELSAGLQKAAEGIQEAQTAMIVQPQPQPAGATPPL